jgi:UDP:flavonoid glycosyltransferase YjiC (YdhE family)
MATIPQFGDQHHNAERVTDLQLGLQITEVTAQGVARGCRHVLQDERIRENVQRARQAMEDLPSVDAAIDHLTGLRA